MNELTDWMGELVPGMVWFAIFAFGAAGAFLYGFYALITVKRHPTKLERWYAISLALVMFLTIMVDKIVFAIAFYVGAARMTGLGLLFWIPGVIALVASLVFWALLVGGRRRAARR